MKTFSHRLLRLTFLLAGLAAATMGRAQGEAASVQSPTARQDALDAAKKLLAPREVATVTADPFHPEAFNEVVAAMGRVPGAPTTPTETAPVQPTGPRSDRDLVQAIAAGLKPSGFFVLGGQPTLVFGQKRVKAGGSLTITFEGAEYALEITTIAPPNFTLRLNREEFTRTIK